MSSNTTTANTARPIVFMDINIGETPAGRLKMELFSDIVPKCGSLIVRKGGLITLHISPGRRRTSGSYAPGNTGEASPRVFSMKSTYLSVG
jgi:hypothetical protein